jgi:tartrate dehydrogenase/decarboxylase/D-malate dehydrogenase
VITVDPSRNPIGAFGSAALMLDHFGLHAEAAGLNAAIEAATAQGIRTRDVGGTAKTAEVTEAVIANLPPRRRLTVRPGRPTSR